MNTKLYHLVEPATSGYTLLLSQTLLSLAQTDAVTNERKLSRGNVCTRNGIVSPLSYCLNQMMETAASTERNILMLMTQIRPPRPPHSLQVFYLFVLISDATDCRKCMFLFNTSQVTPSHSSSTAFGFQEIIT